MKKSLDREKQNNLELEDEFVKVIREMKLSIVLSNKSFHDYKKPSLSLDSRTFKWLLGI